MSTREQHPIDDHFRRSLAAAEVEPPALVWAGVAAAQRGSGRRWGLLFWPLLLLVGVGLAGTFHFFGTSEAHEAVGVVASAEDIQAKIAGQPGAVLFVADTDATQGANSSTALAARDGQEATEAGRIEAAERDASHTAQVHAVNTRGGASTTTASKVQGDVPSGSIDAALTQSSSTASASADVPVHTIGIPTDDEQPIKSMEQAPPVQPMDASAAWAEGISMRPEWMSILPSWHAIPELDRELYRSLLVPAPYVLPRGEWWVGPSVGVIGSRLRWRGDDAELAKAIDNVTGSRRDLAMGIAFGYTWRSGWGLSSGIMWQQGQQNSRLIDRRTVVEQDVISRVVSLDAVVVFSTTDTLTTTTTTETEFKGAARSTVLRIPLQAHWHGTHGRLLYGAHLGLALERTTYRGGPILVRDASDGRIVPVQDGSALGQERLPLTLLGTAGLDLGYQLHERWALRGGPVLMHGLAPLQRTPTVFAMPDRWGLQFHLVHHLYRRSTQ